MLPMSHFSPVLSRLGLDSSARGAYAGRWVEQPGGDEFVSLNPATAESLATVIGGNQESFELAVESAVTAFKTWRVTPPPQRGEVVRQIGQALRAAKDDLGLLVTLETGKIR